ncbi:LysM type receptor kinase [Medicago truncatula]|uniref:LysM type receptor kinase n=1 Tax=Medicago truncatula TaxID=3880 RepID=G7L0A4_MEDTR|nr:LysM type receptor kinase [Medicago truncatula]
MRNTYKSSCNSFLVFRSKPPYGNLTSIAYLLGSETSKIASKIKNISRDIKLRSNKRIIVPICSVKTFTNQR